MLNLSKFNPCQLIVISIAELAAFGLGVGQIHGQIVPDAETQSSCEVQKSTPKISQQPTSTLERSLSAEQLRELAKVITVKVSSKEASGSGIIIQRTGNNYFVVTNQHVLVSGEKYHIRTSDGNQHSVNILKSNQFRDYDLALLQFYSPRHLYPVALLGKLSVKTGDEIFAAGFPIESKYSDERGFVFTNGKISRLMNRAFIGGYQIGNTIDVRQGMSGGPLINLQGEVVGINGLGKYPAFTNPYVFRDRSTVSDSEWQQVSELSWAIPIQVFLQLSPKPFISCS